MSQIALVSLIVECTATLFLSLVLVVLHRHSKQTYLGYWAAGWLALGMGLLAFLTLLGLEPQGRLAEILKTVHYQSQGVAALFAFFTRYAFLRERPVPGWAWLLFLPVCGYVALAALSFPDLHALATLPRRLFFAAAMWASGWLFWTLARREKHGAGILAVSFACWGLQQAHYAVASLLLAEGAPYLDWARLVDTVIVIHVALGMIVFTLDQDRSRLVDSARKLEISETRLKDLAMRDPLTGLFNRRHFDYVAPQIEAQTRRLDFSLAFFVVDLNRFKETNDQEGHQRGDQILRAFADFLREETRASDLIFRWGGDEFLILMMDLTREGAEIKGRQLQHDWDAVRRELGTDVSVAVGWAFLEGDGVEGAIRRADSRMYCDKRFGRRPNLAPLAGPSQTPPA